MTILFQEATCPACRASWDIPRGDFVKAGDAVLCKFGCGAFTANTETITCCGEDVHGLVEVFLRTG